MASRLNLLFRTAPKQFLEKQVLFTDELATPASLALMRDKLANHIDIQPLKHRCAARVLASLHLYDDLPLTSYFVAPERTILVPREHPPFAFVFFPEFTGCRLLIRPDGDDWLSLRCESGLTGRVPPIQAENGSHYIDSFAYWDYTTGDLVGRIRATAVLFKAQGEPWTMFMQQIVGTPGFEVVRSLFSRALRY